MEYTYTPAAVRMLKCGMRGEDVRIMQARLIALGYGEQVGEADGIFGPKTLAGTLQFQTAQGLEPDGIAGPLTFAALYGERNESERAGQDRLARFLDYLEAQLGQIYVWGGNGQPMSISRIYAMEDSDRNARRAEKLYNTRLSEGREPILGYDCSGLISRFLQNEGLVTSKRNSRHLYDMCEKLFRLELTPGDLVFRHNGSRIFHVGAYIGGNMVIEAKGRDDGVVKRDIDASGENYWNRCGRLHILGD